MNVARRCWHETPRSWGDRIAFSFEEVAQKFGSHRSWVYRQVKSGRLRTITGYGRLMISATEIERILSEKEEPNEP